MVKNKEKKLNDKGLTLIELVIAISMSVIILGAAFMFITGAERAYHTAEYGINLQMEGQILMEQIGNWVMECNRIVISPEGNALMLYSIPVDNNNGLGIDDYPLGYTPPRSEAKYRVIFLAESEPGQGKKLYMKSGDGIVNGEEQVQLALHAADDSVFFNAATDAIEENCIGDLTEGFQLSVPKGQDRSKLTAVDIVLVMKKGTKSYTLKNTFSMRNGLFNQFAASEEESTAESSSEGTEESGESESTDEGTPE